jgi:hypothetical protein
MPARPEMGDRVRDSIEFDGVPEKNLAGTTKRYNVYLYTIN